MFKKIILFLMLINLVNIRANNPILPYIYFEYPNSIYEPQCRYYADIVVTEVFDDASHFLNAGYNIYYSY